MVIEYFYPTFLGNLDALQFAPGQHRPSRLGFGSSINIDSSIGGMDEDIPHAADVWLFVGDPLTMSSRYLNPGFIERDHCATENPRLPEGIYNRPNCVFGLWIEIVFSVRAFYPA